MPVVLFRRDGGGGGTMESGLLGTSGVMVSVTFQLQSLILYLYALLFFMYTKQADVSLSLKLSRMLGYDSCMNMKLTELRI